MELPPPRALPLLPGCGLRARVLPRLREAMPCCSGESPARGRWGSGNGVGSSRQRGRRADSRGWGPGELLEHPCGASRLLSQPPLRVSPLPRQCAGLGRGLLLATAAARQPEPPRAPGCHRHPRTLRCSAPHQWHREPRPGGSRGAAARSCTLRGTALWGWSVGAAGLLCPLRVQRQPWLFLLHRWSRMWPGCVTLGFSFTPSCSPLPPARGAMLGAHGLRLSCKFPSSLCQPH